MTDTTAANIETADFDLATMDAIVTIHNPATGAHRTFRVKTMTKGGMEGKRIVSLLTGPDNENSYQGFGFADGGTVKVWSKFRGTEFEVFGRMLANPAHFAAKGAEYMIERCCNRCGRRLTTPESIARGLGPECATKD